MRLRLPRRRPSTWFVVAGVLATVAALATMRLASATVATEGVVVAADDLAVGTRFGDADLRLVVREIPQGGRLSGMFADPSELVDAVLSVPVDVGEPVTIATVGGRADATAGPLAHGERAVSIPAAAAGAGAALLVPGVRVDVVSSSSTDGDARIVVANVEVLTRHSAADPSDGQVGEAILLRVPEEDALRLTAALDTGGGVRLLPRPIGDATEDDAP